MNMRGQFTAATSMVARPFRIARIVWHDLRQSPRTGRASNLWAFFDVQLDDGRMFENLRICQRFDGELFLVEPQEKIGAGAYLYQIADQRLRAEIERILIEQVERHRKQRTAPQQLPLFAGAVS